MIQVSASTKTQLFHIPTDVEKVRHSNKTRLVTRVLHGVLPGLSGHDIEALQNVLEIGCGSGAWAFEVAQAYPHLHIMGLDERPTMIEDAQRTAWRQGYMTLSFASLPAMSGPFDVPTGSVDLLSTQFMSIYLAQKEWLPFLTECYRVLRPGGIVRLTEWEMPWTNAPAHKDYTDLFWHAMYISKRGFPQMNRTGRTFPMLARLLTQTGFSIQVERDVHMNYSFGAPNGDEWRNDLALLAKGAIPFLVETGIETKDVIADLWRRQQEELASPMFQASLPLKTFLARKPEGA